MQQLLTSIFLKTKGTSPVSSVEIPDSNLFTDPLLNYRSLSITPSSFDYSPITLSCSQHTLPIKSSHPILLSSKSSINSRITIKSVVSTISENVESRTITLQNLNQPQIKPYIGNSYIYNKSFPYNRININKFPNEPVNLNSGLNQDNTPVVYTIPNYSSGCQVCSSSIDVTKSVSSTAWGLILAALTDREALVISTLNSILYSLSNNSSIILAPGGAKLNTFLSPLSDSVYDNSLLGYSICLSLKYLTSKSNLYLPIDNFYRDCLVATKALAIISCNAINPINNFSYGSLINGSFNQEDLSFETSVISSLFFNSFLSIDYDSTIHYKAAKLYLAILELPLLPSTIQYSIFVNSSDLSILAYKLWWHLEFDKLRSNTLLLEYNKLRSPTPNDITAVYTTLDFIVASLTNLYLYNNRPNWVYWLFEQYKLDSKLQNLSTLSINRLTMICCYEFSFDLINNYEFDTYATSARAYTAYAKNLLSLTLPEGDYWALRENHNNPFTVIGSLLHAYSAAIFNISLQYSLLKQPLFSNTSYLLRKIAKIILPPSIYLPEPTLKSYISTLLNNSLTPTQKLNSFFNTNFVRYFETVQNYKVLLDRQTKQYSNDITVYNHEFLNSNEYQSIAFYPTLNLKTENQNSVNVLVERSIPGLPYSSSKTSPLPGTTLSTDESNIHILPLTNLTGVVNLEANISAPNNLYLITNLLTPAGIVYRYLLHYFNSPPTNKIFNSFCSNVVIGAKITIGTSKIII